MKVPSFVNEIIPVMNIDNYEEFYKRWLEQKNNPDYGGKRTYDEIIFEENTKKETKYAKYNAFKNIKGEEIAYPQPDKETVEQFLIRCGFDNFEGSSKAEHMIKHKELVREHKPKLIAEIGFNTGVSALHFLSLSDDIIVVSFDILYHHYAAYAKMYVDMKYPGRHTLIGGDSSKSVLSFFKTFNTKFDLVFIDGGHTRESSMADLVNCYEISHENTIVIMDNVVVHRGLGNGVYDSLMRCKDDLGIINVLQIVEIGDYIDAFAICKYNKTPETLFTSNPINYDWVERRFETYYYTYKIQKCDSLPKLLQIKKELEEAIRQRPDNFDVYVIVELNRKFKAFGAPKNSSTLRKDNKHKWIL
mgnify:CR=1 FL=1